MGTDIHFPFSLKLNLYTEKYNVKISYVSAFLRIIHKLFMDGEIAVGVG
jgi:hypothetical protein